MKKIPDAAENLALWESAEIDREHLKEIDEIYTKIFYNKNAYLYVQYHGGVPWHIVACIHFREASLNFKTHLHNGDWLKERTVNIPRGRPLTGFPPFSWQESALDALKGFDFRPKAWNLSGSLDFLERYNGLGYRRCGIHSPYLWDWTQHYSKGLFVRDGKFDPEVRENRAGCVVILKTLISKGAIHALTDLDDVSPRSH